MPEYNLVLPNLYVGTQKFARELDELKQIGIGHIVNVTDGRNYHEKQPGFHYFQCPVQDTDLADLLPYFDAACSFIHNARSQGYPVLIHCQQGVSRSGAVCLSYLIKHENMTVTQAYKHLRALRPVCRPKLNFLRQLGVFEKRIRPSTSISTRPSPSPSPPSDVGNKFNEKQQEPALVPRDNLPGDDGKRSSGSNSDDSAREAYHPDDPKETDTFSDASKKRKAVDIVDVGFVGLYSDNPHPHKGTGSEDNNNNDSHTTTTTTTITSNYNNNSTEVSTPGVKKMKINYTPSQPSVHLLVNNNNPSNNHPLHPIMPKNPNKSSRLSGPPRGPQLPPS
jgi:hypothetical protein